jgi:hypothetical protein
LWRNSVLVPRLRVVPGVRPSLGVSLLTRSTVTEFSSSTASVAWFLAGLLSAAWCFAGLGMRTEPLPRSTGLGMRTVNGYDPDSEHRVGSENS